MHGLVHICKSDAYRWHCHQHMHLEMMFASLQIKYDCIYTYVHWSEVFLDIVVRTQQHFTIWCMDMDGPGSCTN
jgi:hypothetical protein